MSGTSPAGFSMPDPSRLQQAQFEDPPGSGADTLQHEQAFADAVQRSQAVEQMDAQPALTNNGVMSGMTDRLDAIASHLRVDSSDPADITQQQQALFSGDPASASPPQHLAASQDESVHDLMQKAMDNYRSTIVYSVEAQVATNGSSTSTKTFNNLLKGS